MCEIIGGVIEYLERECIRYRVEDGGSVIRLGLRGTHGVYNVAFILDEEAEGFNLFLSSNVMVPAPQRAAVAEYLTSVNWRLMVGNLRMDPSDGEVVYHASVFTPGSALSQQMVGRVMGAAVTAMDAAFPGLAAVAFAGLTPDLAVERFLAESGMDAAFPGLAAVAFAGLTPDLAVERFLAESGLGPPDEEEEEGVEAVFGAFAAS